MNFKTIFPFFPRRIWSIGGVPPLPVSLDTVCCSWTPYICLVFWVTIKIFISFASKCIWEASFQISVYIIMCEITILNFYVQGKWIFGLDGSDKKPCNSCCIIFNLFYLVITYWYWIKLQFKPMHAVIKAN